MIYVPWVHTRRRQCAPIYLSKFESIDVASGSGIGISGDISLTVGGWRVAMRAHHSQRPPIIFVFLPLLTRKLVESLPCEDSNHGRRDLKPP